MGDALQQARGRRRDGSDTERGVTRSVRLPQLPAPVPAVPFFGRIYLLLRCVDDLLLRRHHRQFEACCTSAASVLVADACWSLTSQDKRS
jgi:hypothetical protein